MSHRTIPAGERFPLEEIVSATPDEAEAFNDQTIVLQTGAMIRQMREAAGMTQKELARCVETSQSHLSDMERGTGIQGPSVLMLQKIAKACGTTLRMEVGDVKTVDALAHAQKRALDVLGKYLNSPPSALALANKLAMCSNLASRQIPDWVVRAAEQAPEQVKSMIQFLAALPNMEVFRASQSQASKAREFFGPKLGQTTKGFFFVAEKEHT